MRRDFERKEGENAAVFVVLVCYDSRGFQDDENEPIVIMILYNPYRTA